jgi:NADH:ubiquinone oxidoreductase subunit B-like Fe-S oxidoreductase
MIERFIDKKPESALKAIDRLKEKIRNMRRAGLESEKQEYSAENIAFKILRREETLEKLNDMKYNAYDSIMSMRLQ